ncbi:BQ5605_C003g02251 [Microbotryum silenes-dioicae]|uniref:BQ5605_C003g02201 protein n=1 Tax=Microbotryum silenes-dioicae TaxID=796604 RepID=A0A2X0P3S9_9BASI|nr:BQ5605_C003g02201 [Microbotryum silenes-dioicae]SGY39636.1 BQ5605_C003g02251 [Microbotryum silenes-dioicae]
MEGPQGEKVAGILGVRVNPANLAQSLPPSIGGKMKTWWRLDAFTNEDGVITSPSGPRKSVGFTESCIPWPAGK